MISSLQPQRPKPPQQRPQPTLPHQQTRATHNAPLTQPTSHSYPQPLGPQRPRSQLEAMPPFSATSTSPFSPPRAFYDSAVRHPVFFTEQLRKPPFPIPQMASQGWSPVASGYIQEQKRLGDTAGKMKL
ncbi:hypothetical protein P280DRAFT_545348 [Massarina eburnea CBS 473.64]|uniref:Uncharacterized protein n=1 Tax=Massarina eburnea CBS 473.64 TaxID=1395130 RepID=A0A6A6SE09_9PLEO|nr:hypothetical protein P280DRAFT_545348 [Massarina eburnea CBS 473.64]